jgi:DNA-cytosine methyltransferase
MEGQSITVDTRDTDLLVAGFPCSPFSPSGKREGFEGHMAECFKYCVGTIKSVRPRGFILENVPGVLGKSNKTKLNKALDWLKPMYDIQIHQTNSLRYDLPQDRPRVYIIGLRRDAMQSRNSLTILLQDIGLVEAAIQEHAPKTSWDVWLQDRGMPIQPAGASSPEFLEAHPCPTCGPNKVCPHHVCPCDRCVKSGTTAKKCMWREHTKEWLNKNKKRIGAYKRQWGKVRQSKRSPDYYDLAQAKKLRIPKLLQESPRVRAAVSAWSSTVNMLAPSTIVNCGQAVHRAFPKCDGHVPTLTTTCGKLFAPVAGVFLEPQQCLAMQGFDCSKLPIEDFSKGELYTLAGMAMSVPVVGLLKEYCYRLLLGHSQSFLTRRPPRELYEPYMMGEMD